MAKSAVLLGIVLIISSTYYLAFWGSFGIDVFQYIAVGDIAKGGVYAFRDAISLFVFLGAELLVALVILIFLEKYEKKVNEKSLQDKIKYLKKQKNLFSASAAFATVIAGLVGFAANFVLYNVPIEYVESLSIYVAPITALAVAFVYAALDKRSEVKRTERIAVKKSKYLAENKKSAESTKGTGSVESTEIVESTEGVESTESIITQVFNYLVISAATYFLVSALVLGVLNSRKIKDGFEYDYVENAEFLGNNTNGCIIYLGYISDKYIFLNQSSEVYFIVNKDKVPTLGVRHHALLKKDADISGAILSFLPSVIIHAFTSESLFKLLGIIVILFINKKLCGKDRFIADL